MANNNGLYTVEYHHGGCFVNNCKRDYIGGQISYEYGIDADETSLIELKNHVEKALRYGIGCRLWCRLQDNNLRLLNKNKDVYETFLEHHLHRKVVLFIEY